MSTKTGENKKLHLTANELAMAGDALVDKTYGKLDIKIRKHIEECESCSINLMELVDVIENKDEQISITPKINKKTSWDNKKWLVAASLFLTIVSSFFAWRNHTKYTEMADKYHDIFDSTNTDDINNTNLTDTAEKLKSLEKEYQLAINRQKDSLAEMKEELIKKEMQVASLYIPNPSLEKEMSLTLRNGAITLNSPKQLRYIKNDVLKFDWNSGPSALALVIYNNRGLKLKTTLNITKGHLLPLKQFSLGTYYYELYFENDLVAIDKFEIH